MTIIGKLVKATAARLLNPHFSGPPQCRSHCHAPPRPPCQSSPLPGRRKLKIMFFGTDEFAVESLATLHRELGTGGCVAGLEVVSLPLRPPAATPVTKFAQDKQLTCHVWPPDKDLITRQQFDLGVVASFGKLIPTYLIHSFPLGMINVHGSLLPRWRGAAPVVAALAAGDTRTGVTIMRVRPHKFDVGEVLAMQACDICEEIRRPELTARLARLGAGLLLATLQQLETALERASPQEEAGASLAPAVTRARARLDWAELSAWQVYNLWRALGDLYRLRSIYSSTGLSLRLGTVLHPRVLAGAALDTKAEPGTLTFLRRSKRERFLCVKCREGWVAFSDIYYHNKKVMSPLDFYNGLLSRPGPHKLLRDDG